VDAELLAHKCNWESLIIMLRTHRDSVAKVGNLVPRGLFVFACIAIVAFSFWGTLLLVDRRVPSSRQEVALPPGTPQSPLVALPPLPDTGVSWLGIEGVNAQVVPGVAAVDGQAILRLIAVQDGLHTVAAQVGGLVKNKRYRITAWVRPQAGANFGIGARDQVDQPNGPNYGRVTFDLSNRNVLTSDGNARAGIKQVGEWLTAWIDLPTADGNYVVNFYIYSGAQFSFAGDGKLGVLLGGVAVD
jgi:hypothetical protein